MSGKGGGPRWVEEKRTTQDPYRDFDPTARLDKHQREINDAMLRIGKLEKLETARVRADGSLSKRYRRRVSLVFLLTAVACLLLAALCAENGYTWFCGALGCVSLLCLVVAGEIGTGTWS